MNQESRKGSDRRNKNILSFFLISFFLLSSVAFAQTSADFPTNPNDKSFKLIVCDGPTLPDNVSKPANYVPCDFNGLMKQVQHLINIAFVLGALGAVIGFSYAGYLYIKGTSGDRTRAHEIFRKVFLGLIIMLSAWFIVYQLLDWLTDNQAFKTLLGNPK